MKGIGIKILSILLFVSIADVSTAKEIKDIDNAIAKASEGNSSYQSDLIDYYYNTAKDYDKAIYWCNILKENNSGKGHNREYACRILGYCAYEGKGMDKSLDKAIEFFKKSVEYGGSNSALELARISESELLDSIAAIEWYTKAALLENKTAALRMAKLYENGYYETWKNEKIFYPGVSVDISKAVEFYNIYVSHMDIPAMKGIPANPKLLYKIANWYYTGAPNLKQDFNKAFQLFNESLDFMEKSKDENKLTQEEEGIALWNISVCYRFGRGVEKDELLARRYVKKAAEKGNEKAIELLSD